MSLIPPPSDEETKRYQKTRDDSRDDSAHDESTAAMTLSAIGKGGDGGPLGLDSFGDADASSGDLSRWTQHSAFALVAVAVIAVVVLVAMRMTAGSMAAASDAAAERLVEETLTKWDYRQNMLPGDASESMGSDSTALADATTIIYTLTGSEKPRVPIEYVQKNPFELGIKRAERPVAQVDTTESDAQRAERVKANIRRSIRTLSIDMIMDGTEEKAVVINGNIHKIGDTIDIFQIESIEPQQIFLRHDRYRVPLRVGS